MRHLQIFRNVDSWKSRSWTGRVRLDERGSYHHNSFRSIEKETCPNRKSRVYLANRGGVGSFDRWSVDTVYYLALV
jgi:hypothetical protein